ncbi:BAR/IMD domain-containing adapter protein 2-like 2 [Ranitomeya imitator]|uniref:BAR/IMD domain-containing adapter protein 2-like 2 n=1 Tax=Ranitomeya imitator TaxID=111125 RepID=UPI0037E904E2
MAREMDSIYTSTIASYKKILGQFNPALENLVYLGNNYVRALSGLSEVAESYFNAIRKIGEQALQNSACHGLGQILIQMADNCKNANSGLQLVVQTLHGEIVQQMGKNTKLDMQFIRDSQNRYEMEYRQRASTLDKCMQDAWKMERQRDRNLQSMKEKVNMLHSDMLSFVRESQHAAELEEKRRYRFLAERQWLLCNTFVQYHNRAHGVLNIRLSNWNEQIDASRVQIARSVVDVVSMVSRQEQNNMRGPVEHTTRGLPRSPSNGTLGSSRSRSNSFGEVAVAAVAAAAANTGNRKVQAIVDHKPVGNPTMLQFSKGNVITLLVSEARNGWLYGRLDALSTAGWFPEAYVKSMDADFNSRPPILGHAHSASDLLDATNNIPQPDYKQNAADQRFIPTPSNAAPPPPPMNNSVKKSGEGGVRGNLFPKGTNPFATVKLRPTVTNDRSAPLIR